MPEDFRAAGIGRILQERREPLSELGDVIEQLDRRPVAVGDTGEVYDGVL